MITAFLSLQVDKLKAANGYEPRLPAAKNAKLMICPVRGTNINQQLKVSHTLRRLSK